MTLVCGNCGAENESGADTCFTCGAPMRQVPSIIKGTLLANRYEIIGRLGRGGFGSVYKAKDRLEGEVIALKVLNHDLTTPDMIRRFHREVQLARRVAHKNVCRVFEDGSVAGLYFLTMQFVDGKTLREILEAAGPLRPEDVYDTTIQIADALAAIHSQSIVHRDLKTANVMKTHLGLVKVMDFGLSKPMESDATPMTRRGAIFGGSPAYMSPEQIRDPGGIDYRADIYALGIVLYELLTGSVPFIGETIDDVLLKHLTMAPPLAGPGAVSLPSEIVPVLSKSLEKDREHRYATAAIFGEAIRAASAQSVAEVVTASINAQEAEPAQPPSGVSRPEPSRVSEPTPVLPPPSIRLPPGVIPTPTPKVPAPRSSKAQQRLGMTSRETGIYLSVILLVVSALIGKLLWSRAGFPPRESTPRTDLSPVFSPAPRISPSVQARWLSVGHLTHARKGHVATLLKDGRVFISGGSTASGKSEKIAEMYDPRSTAWRDVGPIETAIGDARALLTDDRILSVDSADVTLVSPETGVLETVTSPPEVQVREYSRGHQVTALSDGRVLVTGGRGLSIGFVTNTIDADTKEDCGDGLAFLFSPVSKSFKRLDDLEPKIFDHAAVLLGDGRVLVTGGAFCASTDGDGRGEPIASKGSRIFTAASETFRRVASTRYSHREASAFMLPDGKVWVNAGSNPDSRAEVYDPGAGKWEVTEVEDSGGVLVKDSRIMFVHDSEVRLYRTSDKSWESISIPGGLRRSGASWTVLADGSALIVGGSIKTAADNEVKETLQPDAILFRP